MRNNAGISIFSAIFLIIFWPANGRALEKKTHEVINSEISKRAINGFSLNTFLKNQLGLKEGINERIKLDSVEKTVSEWLGEGGKTEDEPVNRSFNHFHNPLKSWDKAGLDTWIFSWQSSILWAQNANQNSGGNWSWQDARKYYYQGLTSIDKTARDKALANTFRALGQLMHLVQDASVPAHCRNDIHIQYNYESWLEDIQIYEGDTFQDFINSPIPFDQSILDISPNPLAPIPISRIIDTDRYNGDNPGITVSNTIGIAEYTNANFFSEGTVFSKDFPYPALTSVEKADYLIPHPRDKAKTVTRQYYKKIGDGEVGYRLATVGFLRDYIVKYFKDYTGLERKALDGGVLEDYARRLLPRAVGYSAGLLEYFFRGELKVNSLPLFFKNNLSYVKLKIKNLTATKETMMNGNFILTYRYTPKGGAKDGSQDIFGRAWALDGSLFVPCNELKYYEKEEDGMAVFFQMIPALSKGEYESIQFMLAFRGTLGKEEGAVIGKFFTPGEVLFGEEWENGLTGNHTWGHTGLNTGNNDPENGVSLNDIAGDTLIKDNILYPTGHRTRCNETLVSTYCCNQQFRDILPILVTPNTHVFFKIDAMWIDPIPWSFPGYATQWQGLWLYFSGGLKLEFSVEDQYYYDDNNTAVYFFPLGVAILDNIYELFKICEIQIPEGPLYLEAIVFVQQLVDWNTSVPIDQVYHQHMEVDFIQILEEKEQ